MPLTSRQPEQEELASNSTKLNRLPSDTLWSLELRQHFRTLLKWWWLLLIGPLLSAAIAYYAIQHSSKYYQARALLNIGPPLNKVEGQAPLLVTIRLGAIYRQIVNQSNFASMVIQRSGVSLTEEQLQQAVLVQFSAGTPFFEIQIIDSNASRSLLILHTISDLLTQETPQLKELRQNLQRQFLISRQLELTKLIQDNKAQLDDLAKQLAVGEEESAQNILLERNSSSLKAELLDYEQELKEIGQFTGDDEPNQIHVIEEPHLVATALGPQPKNAAIAMGILSLVLLIALVYILEKLDNQVLSRQQVEQLLGHKVIMIPDKRLKNYNLQCEMLAADLLATYSYVQSPVKLRILLLHEQFTSGVPQMVQSLSEALANLGVTVTVSYQGSSQREARKDGQEVFVDTVTSKTDPASTGSESIQNLVIAWELVIQSWPTGLKYLSLLSQKCDKVLVLCSYKRSKKKNLIELASFLATAQPDVTGVLVL